MNAHDPEPTTGATVHRIEWEDEHGGSGAGPWRPHADLNEIAKEVLRHNGTPRRARHLSIATRSG